MRELLFMSLFCEKIAENMGYAENAFERIKEVVKNMLYCYHNNREDDGMIDAKSIGIMIRELRVKKGIMQEQLSGLAALGRTHYSKIERGLRSPNVDTLFKIVFALNMKPHELVEIIEKM